MKRKIISARKKGNINTILNVVNANDESSKEFERFLKTVREDTLAVFNQIDFHTLEEDVEWNLVGVEFRLSDGHCDEKYQKYSEEVRNMAFRATIPLGLKENSSWLSEHDFINSDIKLGCLVREFVSASPILDLGYFKELLASQDCPCYIDENNIFHINAIEPTKESAPKMRTVH